MREDIGPFEQIEASNIQRALDEAWAGLLSDKGGRLLVHDIIRRTGVYDATMSSGDRAQFYEGMRYVGLELMRCYLKPASAHAQMLLEEEERFVRLSAAREMDRNKREQEED